MTLLKQIEFQKRDKSLKFKNRIIISKVETHVVMCEYGFEQKTKKKHISALDIII